MESNAIRTVINENNVYTLLKVSDILYFIEQNTGITVTEAANYAYAHNILNIHSYRTQWEKDKLLNGELDKYLTNEGKDFLILFFNTHPFLNKIIIEE